MIKQRLLQDLNKAVEKVYPEQNLGDDIVCNISENSDFGDYSTNIALQLSNQADQKSKQTPQEIASKILDSFGHPEYLERIEIAGPGFMNFWIKESELIKNLSQKMDRPTGGKKILVEYASPNAFKPFHIGHLRNIVTGESILQLLRYIGNEVYGVTYTSDIGLSTAKAIWGVTQFKEEYEEVRGKSVLERAKFLGKAYVYGSNKYEESEEYKTQINEINIKLFKSDPEYLGIWQETRDWSNQYLHQIYQRMGTKFEAEVWESEVGSEGKRLVLESVGKIFEENDGAIIFPGEKYGLHTRVFVNSDGNPTYEAKDIGVSLKEYSLFPFDEAIHVVANDQAEYFKVVIKALELIDEKMVGKKKHLGYGLVNLSTGKMASRTGNIVSAEDLIDQVKSEIKNQYNQDLNEKTLEVIALGAIKFYLLKFGVQTEVTFNIKESISLQGDTGPYVQYAYVRTRSVLKKSLMGDKKWDGYLETGERNLLRLIEYFPGIVEQASVNLHPNDLCLYLLNLAKAFNLFYQKYPILNSKEQAFRLNLTKAVGETLKTGLNLLGIEAPERM